MFVYENKKNTNIQYFVQKNGYEPKFVTFNEILESQKSKQKIFLKIDIEGEEYSLLDLIIRYQKKISCLVVEFHNLDEENYEILKKFVSEFSLNLCHTHINISGDFNIDNSPKVIELTFVQNLNKDKKVKYLPHPLDMQTYETNKKYDILFIN